jgi:hypothetical protein
MTEKLVTEALARVDPDGRAALEAFMALTWYDVEEMSDKLRRTSATGVTWEGLSKLMQRGGHHSVQDLGVPAATSWAVHLGIVPPEARNGVVQTGAESSP